MALRWVEMHRIESKGRLTEGGGVAMLAAMGMGLIGTIIVVAIVIALVVWFLNRT
jgi:hypothetical protein